MNGQQLIDIINSSNSAKTYFKGIFSINTLPKKLTIPSFIICNFDLDKNPGSHWFCLFKTCKTNLECFDSLGLNEQKQNLLGQYCSIQNTNSLIYNKTPVQSSLTSTCGKFALYFAFHRLHNLDLSFTELLNEIFNDNIDNNELEVIKFFDHHGNE